MPTSPELPTEIWLRIAEFIPDDHFSTLGTVCRLFYQVEAERKYRHLVLDDDRPAAINAHLDRIEKQSLVMPLVNSISLYPRAVRSACLRSGRSQKKSLKKANHRGWPASFRVQTAECSIPEDLDLADRLLTGLSILPNVRNLRVEWERPCAPEAPFCFPFLTALWPSLGQRLTSLSLETGLDAMSRLVENASLLPFVQVLRLTLGPNMINPDGVDEASQQQKHLASFINGTSSTLVELSISSIEHFRLCTLYNGLRLFPHLRILSLHLPFDPLHLDDPKGMNSFLRVHARIITKLSFIPTHCCKRADGLWKASLTAWPDPDAWLPQLFAGIRFNNLETLELGLNTTGGEGRVLQARRYIGAVINNLGCLKITGVLTSTEDLLFIVRPFTQKGNVPPKKVVLEVHVLCRLFLETIATILPDLETLQLTYRWIDKAGSSNE
ncbi:hypothetical protein DFP72DRAFT_898767, partial [Ephemerocybe angulata]